jgi:hypothetical protein
MPEPLEKIWLHEMVPDIRRLEDLELRLLARSRIPLMLRDAMEGDRGAKCLSCGHVVRNQPPGVRRGIQITYNEIITDEGTQYFWGITCCELCSERVRTNGVEI